MKELADGEDKVRRNVVLVSAVILAANFLGIGSHPLINGLLRLSITDSEVVEVRVLLLEMFVLVYLFVRFRFTKFFAVELAAVKGTYKELVMLYIEKQLIAGLNKWGNSRVVAGYIKQDMSEWLDAADIRLPNYSEQKNELRLLMTPSSFIEKSYFSGHIHVAYEVWLDEVKLLVSSGHSSITYDFRGWHKLRAQFNALIETCLYSRSSIEFIVPIFLSFAAFVVVASKFFTVL